MLGIRLLKEVGYLTSRHCKIGSARRHFKIKLWQQMFSFIGLNMTEQKRKPNEPHDQFIKQFGPVVLNTPDTFWEEKWSIGTKKAIHRLKYK